MEKVIYAVWKDDNTNIEDFNTSLVNVTGKRLAECAHSVRVNVKDADVAGGTSAVAVATKPQMDAIVQIWIDSANDALRAPYDKIISEGCERFDAWLVNESVPLRNTEYLAIPGQRTTGFSQVVFLSVPENLSWENWRDIWQNSHTLVATDTQSNFEYRQNLITRRLTPGAKNYAAIVEECFPIEALHDPLVYFDAPGDEAKMQANLRLMMDSVARFIDHTKMDCMPTSQYEVKVLGV